MTLFSILLNTIKQENKRQKILISIIEVTDDEVMTEIAVSAPVVDELNFYLQVVLVEIVHSLAHDQMVFPEPYLNLSDQPHPWEKDVLHLVVRLVILVGVDVLLRPLRIL